MTVAYTSAHQCSKLQRASQPNANIPTRLSLFTASIRHSYCLLPARSMAYNSR